MPLNQGLPRPEYVCLIDPAGIVNIRLERYRGRQTGLLRLFDRGVGHGSEWPVRLFQGESAVRARCTKCGHVFGVKDDGGPGDMPVVVCPKCRNVVILKDEVWEDIDAEVVQPDKAEPLSNIYRDRHHQAKRYLVLVVALLITFLSYQIIGSLREKSMLSESRLSMTKSMVKHLALAQERYYMDNNTYAGDLKDLAPAFKGRPAVLVRITRADTQGWVVRVHHRKCSTGLVYESDNGGFTGTYEVGADASPDQTSTPPETRLMPDGRGVITARY